jgi:membrane protein
MHGWKKFLELIKQTFGNFSQANGSLMAAALAYYALFSISPLLVLTVTLSRWILGSTGLIDAFIVQLSTFLPPAVTDTLRNLVESYMNNAFSSFPAIISLAIMLFGASIVFAQLKTALNQIWGLATKPERNLFNFIRTQGLAFASVMFLGFLLVAMTFSTTILNSIRSSLVGNTPLIEFTLPYLDLPLSAVVFTVIFALLFKILPDASVAWKDIWLGALVTAVAFTIGESLLGLYLSRNNFLSAYGVASSLVVLMVWIYYSSQILLFGAAFTKTYAELYGSKLHPNASAMLTKRMNANTSKNEPHSYE